MNSFFSNSRNKKHLWTVMIACLVLFSIVSHTLSQHHRHPAFLGEGIQALAHGEDKKWLVLLAVMFVWVFVEDFGTELFSYLLKFPKNLLGQSYLQPSILKLHNFILKFLRRGLLEPKFY